MINPAAANHLHPYTFRCVVQAELLTQPRFFGLPPLRWCNFNGKAPKRHGAYAFLTEETVLRVGSTGIGKANLFTRVKAHLSPHGFYKDIFALLDAGHRFEVWVCTDKDQIVTTRSGRRINGFSAIEYDLIDRLQPPWNVIGTMRHHPPFTEGAYKATEKRRARKAVAARGGSPVN